jgi:hypothetical protein
LYQIIVHGQYFKETKLAGRLKIDTVQGETNFKINIGEVTFCTVESGGVSSFTGAQRGSITPLTSGATITPNFASNNFFTVTLTQSTTFAAPTNLVAGQAGVIFLVQDTTGSRTAAWNSVYKFPGGTAPTLSTAPNTVDMLTYVVKSNTEIISDVVLDIK